MEKQLEVTTAPVIRRLKQVATVKRAVIAQRKPVPAAVQRNTAPKVHIRITRRSLHTAVHLGRAESIPTMFTATRTPRALQMISGRSSTTTKMTTMMRMRHTTTQRTTGSKIIEHDIWKKGERHNVGE